MHRLAALTMLALTSSWWGAPLARADRIAYVANALDGTVSAIDVRSGGADGTIAVGCEPRDVVALPDGSRVYVANTCFRDPDRLVDTVSVIDTGTNAVVATVDVGTAPVAVAVDAPGTRVYVANSGQKDFLDSPARGPSP
jgi:YVTN family beta-propeller protein